MPPSARLVEPVAAVGDPPAYEDDGDGREKRPPEREGEIGYEAENEHAKPEDLALHGMILVRGLPGSVVTSVSGEE